MENTNSTGWWREIYNSLSRGIFTVEQKGRRYRSRGTVELLYIDQNILNGSKTWPNNYLWRGLATKGRWLISTMLDKMCKIINFTEKNMENKIVKLTVGGKSFIDMKILRRIFQGHALSPLLFVMVMMPLNHIFRKFTDGYKLHKLQEKSLNTHWRHQIVSKNEKELKTLTQALRIHNQHIGIKICHGEMCQANDEKQKKT